MADWSYGKEGKAYPVKSGQVWKAGRHIFVCSDLMESSQFDNVVDDQSGARTVPTRRILYSDPPWNQSNVNSFRTKAGLEKATHKWEQLIRRVATVGLERSLPCWIEGSALTVRGGDKTPGAIGNALFTGYAQLTYYNKHISGLYYAGAGPAPDGLLDRLAGVDDEHTPGIVMEAYGPEGIVIDPCAGRGLTSRHAEKQGWTAVTNELNPVRVSAALYAINAMGLEPKRWG